MSASISLLCVHIRCTYTRFTFVNVVNFDVLVGPRLLAQVGLVARLLPSLLLLVRWGWEQRESPKLEKGAALGRWGGETAGSGSRRVGAGVAAAAAEEAGVMEGGIALSFPTFLP